MLLSGWWDRHGRHRACDTDPELLDRSYNLTRLSTPWQLYGPNVRTMRYHSAFTVRMYVLGNL